MSGFHLAGEANERNCSVMEYITEYSTSYHIKSNYLLRYGHCRNSFLLKYCTEC